MPAAGGQDHGPALVQHALQRLALQAPVVVLAVQGEDLGQGQARRLLDAAVQLHEGHAQPAGEAAPDGGLARAAQAEQRDDGERRRRPASASRRPLSRAAGVVPSARASAASLRTEMLPSPDSTWTRKRAERPERAASSLQGEAALAAQRARAPAAQAVEQPVGRAMRYALYCVQARSSQALYCLTPAGRAG